MSSFWFIVAFVFFILWLSKKPKVKPGDVVDPDKKDYTRGYYDGYQAHKNGAVYALEEIPSLDADDALLLQPVESPIETEAEIAELKEKNSLKNINVTLYIASFLLVGAAALFIGAAMDESIRFVGIWFVTIAFYVAGLAIYDSIEKLRPAAVAFTGTGLALIPFTGMAMYSLVLHDASICWFVTSVIGLIAFMIAATRLQSQVISYIAIAFGASFATSGVAILHVGLMWSFVVLILFGALITFIASAKSSLVSACFSKPIQQSNQWIVPLTLIASLFATTGLSTQDYAIISFVSAIYYGAVAVSSVEDRAVAIFFARVLASISAVLMTYDISSHSWTSVGLAISIISVLQLVVSALSLPEHVAGDANNETWLWLGFIAQLSGMLFVLQDTSWAYIVTGQLLVLLTTSFGLSYLLRRSLVTVFGTIALAILPVLIAVKIIQPVLDSYWVALIFIAFSAGVLAVRTYIGRTNISSLVKSLLFINLGLFMVEALILTASVPDGWGFGIWLAASLLLYYSVYIERLPQLIVAANMLLLITSLWFVKLIDVDTQWMSIVISWLTFGAFYGAYWLAVDMSKKTYGVYFWWSAVIVTGIINLTNLFGSSYYNKSIVTIAGLGVVIVALVLAIEGYKTRRYAYFDAGAIMATIGLQRLVGIAAPDINYLIYTHWWAIVFASLSYLYSSADKQQGSKIRLIIALFMVSFFTGTAALGATYYSDIPYKSIFLAEHIAILIIGSVLSRKLITIWGAVGIILAVLWMLAGYTWVILGFAALALIAFAVYALNKQSKNTK
ncbi:hypothetical protein COV88_02425 [Candidatus Saccharibacteria bacterium CG11_big_fil_rev_8_21_14_0_20_41_19]|nr:hypothetical protein [Candidatus Saccharibacteria bacterium]OIP86057.1 MAG: hypothetical protein AUK57_01970 [Candidatus Saccharibacteria bacterium CG2_30_41_52]PIQ70751.1 MAG: hypothetical protein COV88_02425 [Candidatus Saccharibacteria bacterium CG11_big_fil_rev_8_21_14_0_20_41_19]PIZ60340.1 MAG: hypothetical protein COY18_01470 [Candidatus Saccharibacteria bacterium CG_4_10_14_0_2_um_filter_41_11]PJC30022.1 MAG: hypothetical protein CO052_00160 [Candidatus Saccharibacteria bacterium CG_4